MLGELKMKDSVIKSALLGICGLATACGSYEEKANKVIAEGQEEIVNSDNQLTHQADEALLSLSLPIAEKKRLGVIVAENSISAEQADELRAAMYPPPPAQRCIVHAASHLVKVVAGKGAGSFSATVSYPQGLRFQLTDKSCKDGQLVHVRAGMGFKGTAITRHKYGVAFRMGSVISTPIPIPELCTLKYPSVCEVPPSPLKSCFVFGGRSNISLRDDAQNAIFIGTVIVPRGIVTPFRSDECAHGTKLIADSIALQNVLSDGEQVALPQPPVPCRYGVVTNCKPELPVPKASETLQNERP